MNALPLSMSDFLSYCKIQRSLSKPTIRAYQQDLMAYAKWLNIHPYLGDEHHQALVPFISNLREGERYSPATIRRRLLTIKAFVRWYDSRNDGPDNGRAMPSIAIKIPRRIPRPVERGNLKTVFQATRYQKPGNSEHELGHINTSDPQITTALATRLLMVTGIRIGELVAIKISDVVGTDGRIRIHGKGNRERTVYVTNGFFWSLLAQYASTRAKQSAVEAPLFINANGNKLSEAAFRKRLRTLSTQLSIEPHLTPHQFRHSAATMLIEEGVDIRLVQRLLGHASIATTEIYTRVSDNLLKTAITAADTLSCVDLEL